MPKKYAPEFKRDVVTVARRGDLTVPEVAVDFDVSEESVRRGVRQADIDDGVVNGQTSSEQSELVQLRLGTAVAAAVGLRESAGAAPADLVASVLEDRCSLLILDNCEHLIDAAAAFAEDLLRRCARVAVLATSREPLGVAGEVAWRVPPLAEGSELFVERARAVRPQFESDARVASSIEELCRRLDGLPLAIELAAARTRVLSVEQIAGGLEDRFRLLGRGARTAIARQQTLQASVAWSYELLTDDLRAVLRGLSAFAGSFDLGAAEAVGVPTTLGTDDVLDSITQLVDRSLVVAEDVGGEARFRLLETIRQYAADRLLEAGETAATRSRHLAYYVERLWPRLSGQAVTVQWVRLCDRENANMQAALEWALVDGQIDLGLRFTGALWQYWLMVGRYAEGIRWATAFDQAAPADVDPAAHGLGLYTRALLGQMQSDFEAAREYGGRALARARQVGHRRLQARCLTTYAYGVSAEDYAAGQQLFEEASQLCRELGDEIQLPTTLQLQHFWKFIAEGCDAALPLSEESLQLADKTGNIFVAAMARAQHAAALSLHGDLDRAGHLAQTAASIATDADEPYWSCMAHLFLSLIAQCRGDLATAEDELTAAKVFLDRVRGSVAAAQVHLAEAELAMLRGDVDRGTACAQRSRLEMNRDGKWAGGWAGAGPDAAVDVTLAVAHHLRGDDTAADAIVQTLLDAGIPWTTNYLYVPIRLGSLLRDRGDLDRAEDVAHQALTESLRLTARLMTLLALELVAVLHADRQRDDLAVRLLASAAVTREKTRAAPLFGGPDPETTLAALRQRMLDIDFAAAWADGTQLTLDEAGAEAIRLRH